MTMWIAAARRHPRGRAAGTPALLSLALMLLAACAEERALPRLEEGWEYTLTTSRSTPPRDAEWHARLAPDGKHDLWMRNRIPVDLAEPADVVFRAYVAEIALFVDDTRVYSFADAARDGKLTLHVARLPEGSAGKRVYVRVPRARDRTLFGTSPVLASPGTLAYALDRIAHAPMREVAFEVTTAMLLVIVGLIAVGASMIRRRGDSLALLYFGIFTVLYGARLGIDTYIPLVFGVSLLTASYIISFITYVIPIAGWLLGARLIGPGWKSTLRWQVVVFSVFAPIAIVSDIVTRTPRSLDMVNNVLVITGGLNVLANLLYARRSSTLELRVVLGGALFFLAFALNNNLAALGVVPWDDVEEAIGYVIFTACLGFASVRGFIRGEREQIAIDNELQTAREIQRSLLPSTMPEVRGLRFHARYDPATSVAGDLYAFLRVDDDHIGVLVADVSGHGVPAALIASMVKVAVSSQSRLADDPAAMLQELDRTLRREVRREFVTATYLWFDMSRREVVVTNAGHAPPLLFRSGAFTDLGEAGVLLGRFANATRRATRSELLAGDRIVAFTDGIIEARNSRDEQFGEERLQEIIRRASRDAATLAETVFAEVHRWRGDDADDLTIVVVDVV